MKTVTSRFASTALAATLVVPMCLSAGFFDDTKDAIKEVVNVLPEIEGQSSGIWDFDLKNDFIPRKGGIKVCKEQKKVIVGFYLSENNMKFYSQKFTDGSRKPIGFEIDVHDRSGVFDRENITSFKTSFHSGLRYDDNYFGDPSTNKFAVAIGDPTYLAQDTWHTVEINFSDYVDKVPGEYEVSVQLVGDLRELRRDHNDLWDQYSNDVNTVVNGFFLTLGIGNNGGNNYFNVRKPSEPQRFWKKEFFEDYDRWLWDLDDPFGDGGQIGDFSTYSCEFGSDPWDNTPIEDPKNHDGDGNYNIEEDTNETIDDSSDGLTTAPSKPTNLVVDLDIQTTDGTKVDDKTVPYNKQLKLRAELWAEYADAEEGAVSKNIDHVETDFFISLDKQNWQKIGERQYTKLDNLKKSSPKKEDGHAESVIVGPLAYQAGTVLYVKACTDTEQEIGEKDEGDNCDIEKVTFTEPVYPDLVTHSFGFYHYTPKHPGDLVNVQAIVANNGNGHLTRTTRLSYEYKRDGTDRWVMFDSDELKKEHLQAGDDKWEAISKDSAKRMPNEPGWYTFRACADYPSYESESDEGNNCDSFRHEITEVMPSITITSPRRGEKWKSNKDHWITWTAKNLPWHTPIILQYELAGRPWATIHDGHTKHDGKKKWKMDKNCTKDDRNARIRILRRSDGKVLGVSEPFFADRKKGTPKC